MSVNVNMCIYVEAETEAEAIENAESEIFDFCDKISSFDSAEVIGVVE